MGVTWIYWVISKKIHSSVGGVWIWFFSGTTHFAMLPFDGLDVRSVYVHWFGNYKTVVNMEDILD
mgnify:CR=1 FL=1